MYLLLQLLAFQTFCHMHSQITTASNQPCTYAYSTIQQESLTGRKFGELSVIHQTKTIQISSYNLITLWLIYSFTKLGFAKRLKRVNSPNIFSTKLSHYMVFLFIVQCTCIQVVCSDRNLPTLLDITTIMIVDPQLYVCMKFNRTFLCKCSHCILHNMLSTISCAQLICTLC